LKLPDPVFDGLSQRQEIIALLFGQKTGDQSRKNIIKRDRANLSRKYQRNEYPNYKRCGRDDGERPKDHLDIHIDFMAFF